MKAFWLVIVFLTLFIPRAFISTVLRVYRRWIEHRWFFKRISCCQSLKTFWLVIAFLTLFIPRTFISTVLRVHRKWIEHHWLFKRISCCQSLKTFWLVVVVLTFFIPPAVISKIIHGWMGNSTLSDCPLLWLKPGTSDGWFSLKPVKI